MFFQHRAVSIMVTVSDSGLPHPLNQLDSKSIRRYQLDAGNALFHQGDSTRGLFYLTSGIVELHRVTEGGHEVLMFRAAAGDTLAEASLFHDTYHCDGIAMEHSEVIECSRTALLAKYQTDLRFALSMSE